MSSRRSHRNRRRRKVASRAPGTAPRAPDPAVLVTPSRVSWGRLGKTSISTLAAIVSIVVGWLYLRARLDISWASPLDPARPFSTPFTIRNAGNVDLRELNISCMVIQATDAQGNIGYNLLTYRPQPLSRLRTGEAETTFCQDVSGVLAHASHVEVAIGVSYRSLLPWVQNTVRRFTAAQASDGTLRWLDLAAER